MWSGGPRHHHRCRHAGIRKRSSLSPRGGSAGTVGMRILGSGAEGGPARELDGLEYVTRARARHLFQPLKVYIVKMVRSPASSSISGVGLWERIVRLITYR